MFSQYKSIISAIFKRLPSTLFRVKITSEFEASLITSPHAGAPTSQSLHAIFCVLPSDALTEEVLNLTDAYLMRWAALRSACGGRKKLRFFECLPFFFLTKNGCRTI